ncbi:radical SAM/SPASM domain-containing protein [Azospirillum picis]|uniref:MoaA/NifB/PqqE/SkfB family radical SAM enzyme n=1 Tax=Azospirillum picis TaxID=488438 RepID=A0ABU0MLE7_9PROT|nr:radical SAM protein [Azospirillum picis]MBP2301088.1 MoaA/NifB/PqqE/SkfB family radical SAM enzyme [Azospirillum picis]MDQ0534292.1 MoaA/NifB/PqqE/SkfB family radical SAM enzyme [Azospirillum picis]
MPDRQQAATGPLDHLRIEPQLDRRSLPHIAAARARLEDLWAKGTDHCASLVGAASIAGRMTHLDLDLTGECALKCFYCDRTPDRYNGVPNRRELTTEERKDIIRQAKALGATTVEFPGAGEPMLDPGFWDIVEYIHTLGMTSVVFTSGYHLDEADADRLYRLGATIFLKYNNIDTTVQDRMVGVRGYGDKAHGAMRILLARGFNRTIPTRLAIDVVVTPKYHDLSGVADLFRWCRDNNVHSYIVTLIPEGMADHKSILLERNRADELIEMMRRIDESEYGLHYEPSRPMGGGYRCRQVNCGLFVNLFGEVYDCNGLSRLIGHARTDSLEAIWTSAYARHVRQRDQDGFCLVRERQWEGSDLSAMGRKLEDYESWRAANAPDEIVERAKEMVGVGRIELARTGAIAVGSDG